MADNLVIVESPAKAGTIGKYLGSNYQVIASMGHIRDLPASKLGVDVDDNFAPQYIIPVKSRKSFTALKKALVSKKAVYLATDLDREGEAIAWHIAEALELGTKKLKVYRITFDEITKEAVTNAIAHPRDLDLHLIDAQQARRVLDRLVGYTLSPVLWRKVYKGLSAGRVQSAALRLIVDREIERNAFKPVEYWSLKALLNAKKGELTASIVQYEGKKIEAQTLQNEKTVNDIIDHLKKAAYTVKAIESKQVKRHPSAPYTTSTFQQDAVNKLGMSSKNAMRTAQKLYEAGHITYMRTDSVDLGSVAKDALRAQITSAFGANYLPEKPNTYKTKTKQAQEAHEAIRPTDPSKSGSQVSGDVGEQKVYDLIRRRTLASQMASAELEQMAISIEAGNAIFRATGQRITFPGFLAAWKGEDMDTDEQALPEVAQGEVLTLKELLPEQHFTEPPPRFSEATLIKSLEELGIGRPSTYAPTIDTLVQRRYVLLEQRRFAPEEVGTIVINLLKEHFPQIVDLNFTAAMEEQLDSVATGSDTYQKLLTDFWGPFNKLVLEKTETIEKVNMEEETDEVCPNCGSPMVIKTGRFGKFLACTKFPECKTTKPLVSKAPSGLICPVCGKELSERRARRGMFFGCSGYPECKFAVWKREQLPAKIEELEKAGEEVKYKEVSLTAFNQLPAHVGETA